MLIITTSLRKHRGIDKDEAIQAVKKNVNFAALMVSLGYADGTIAGAVETTADTIKAALQIIGKDPSSSIVSSYFLMLLKNPQNRASRIRRLCTDSITIRARTCRYRNSYRTVFLCIH